MTVRRDFLRSFSMLSAALVVPEPRAAGQSGPGSAESTALLPFQKAAEAPQAQSQGQAQPSGLHSEQTDDDGLFDGKYRVGTWDEVKVRLREAFKKALIDPSDPVVSWLKSFQEPVDVRLANMIADSIAQLYLEAKQPRYEPQLIEANLRSAAVQLDRCLDLVNEISSIETQGITAGIAYLGFLRLRANQIKLIRQFSAAPMDTLIQQAQRNAVNRYGQQVQATDYEKVRLRGLGEAADAGVSQATLALDMDKKQLALLKEQGDIQADVQLASFARIFTPGSTANYAERHDRLFRFLKEDLCDAFAKIFFAAQGARAVFGIDNVPVGSKTLDLGIVKFKTVKEVQVWADGVNRLFGASDGTTQNVLDAMVFWCRSLMKELDRLSQYENELTIAIPLNQPFRGIGKILSNFETVRDAAKAAKADSMTFSFDLEENKLPFSKMPPYLRVVAIGVSVQATDITQNRARLAALVRTPKQPQIEAEYRRAPLYLANVRLLGGSSGDAEPMLVYDPACRNISPFGLWEVSLQTDTVSTPFTAERSLPDWISGLVLHLKVRVNTLKA